MSRGKLDKDLAAKVERELPSITDLRKATLTLQPDIISMRFPPGSAIPIAAVCLQDVTSTMEEVRYALFESLAHLVWHREKAQPPHEVFAVFFGRFYADDAALRLFTAREHLTEAIICMLEISNEDLKAYRKLGSARKDQLSVLEVGLTNDKPDHPVAEAIGKLFKSEHWPRTMRYRNEWVHSKPPILKGTGICYERRNRLQISDSSIGVSIGGGDEPRYSIEDLLDFIKPAFFCFVEAASLIVGFYFELLEQKQQKMW